ncbi:MAG TPA: endonuclease, partial [Aeromicrobium sp.]|nr:endonuclease [Aeromicrobium sp.]
EVHVIRHGRLAAAGVMPPRTVSGPWVDALLATAETVVAGIGPTPATTHEETELIRRWLTGDRVRLVRGTWQVPWRSSERHLLPLEEVEQARRDRRVG